ncbi:unnamed protein product [Fraxinus pennsylvanica]|uniref:DUF4283 domain-containing protein n=1 Tax=Fraxinus pennsylvanica TaxID=56036 RepID=A0AAD2A3F6_9LAMI|nr:unnamed protein product [Fraxinus pennsylvanica]
MTLDKENLHYIHVWEKLYNIPFEYWTTEGLSHVASVVGRPLYADAITLTRKCLSFAHVCLEINALEENVGIFGHSCSSQTKPSDNKHQEKLGKVWVSKDKAGSSGAANEKPHINDDWTHLVASNSDVSSTLELQMVHNETTELGKEGEVTPVPLAILNENDMSVVYGNDIPVKRVDPWADLVARHEGYAHLPWMVIGDFNYVLSPSEVEGGSSSWPAWQDDLWNCMGEVVVGTLMFCLCSKLKLALKVFNKEHFSCLSRRVTQVRTDLEQVQHLIQHSPLDSSLHSEEALLQKEFGELSRADEGFLR